MRATARCFSSLDYYALLKIERSASTTEIKKAYRSIALNLHPDVNGGCQVKTAAFKEVTDAYDTLSVESSRREYDVSLGIGGGGGGGGAYSPGSSGGGATVSRRQDVTAPRQPPRSQGRSTRVYDYNSWYAEHYGDDLDPTRDLDQTTPLREVLGVRNETRSEKVFQQSQARAHMNEKSAIKSRMEARRQQRHEAEATRQQRSDKDGGGCALQ